MANSALPDMVLMEDANDLVDFLEATGRTIPRTKWAIESIQAVQQEAVQKMLDGCF